MLKKKEVLYRYILTEALERRQLSFTQLSLSKMFGFSLSTVSNALKPLEAIGAIEKRARSFNILDIRKTLTFWATSRNLARDIIYKTRCDLPVQKIEGRMPAEVVFTAYSGYRFLYKDAPADYSEVYVYADKKTLEEIVQRFPQQKGPLNIYVLEKDPFMPAGNIAPLPQIYVDLWNLKEWYSRDYLDALERRLFI